MTARPIRVVQAGAIELYNLPEVAIDRLRMVFRCTNPQWEVERMLHLQDRSAPQWLSYVKEFPDGSVRVPRGAMPIVRQHLGKLLDNAEYVDRRTTGTDITSPIINNHFVPALRDYQAEMPVRLLQHEQGLVILPCGTGKTTGALACVQAIRGTTLILVPTRDLAEQWAADIKEKLGISAGFVMSGYDQRTADIVISIEQSLLSTLEADSSFGRRFRLFIIDEGHRVAARTIQECCNLVDARYRLIATATPDRDDGQGDVVRWTAGETLVQRTIPWMVERGHLMPADIEFVETYYLGLPDDGKKSKRVSRLEKDIVESPYRNKKIVDRAESEVRSGKTTLILTSRKTHVKKLVELAKERGIDCDGVTSEVQWKERKGSVGRFKDGSLKLLVATQLFDQGVDVPRLSRLLLAFPGKGHTATTQRVGRTMRKASDKDDARVIDFVEANVPTCVKRQEERKRLYKSLGLRIL